MKYIAFCLVLLGILYLQTPAQLLLKNGEIPEDFLITLKRFGGWFGPTTEMTINATGDISYSSKGGLTVSLPPAVYTIGKKEHFKITKPKVTAERLKLLIGEFEKIQFFRFGSDFPVEDNKEQTSITDQQTETISIRANGQTKEVSNYLGNSGKRTRLLYNLAIKIRGAGIWYLADGDIPENFQVWYRKTTGDGVEKDYKIAASGKITESIHSLRFYSELGKALPVFVKTKTAGKLSKQQLIKLIGEFEEIGFSTFQYSTLTKYSGCANEPGPDPMKSVHINVQINQISQMYASLYENCAPRPETEAATFERAATVVENLIKTVIKK
jgi:hypothetical protein